MIGNGFRHPLAAAAVALVLLSAAVAPAQLQKTTEPKKDEAKEAAPKTEVKAAAAANAGGAFAKKKAALQKAVVRPAPPVEGLAVDQAQKDAMLENVLRQMRPILRAEMHLIRNTCKPSKEELSKLAKAGEKVLKDVAGKSAEAQLKMQQGIGVQSMPNAVEEIQRSLASAVKADLSTEQAARYQAEVAARAKSEREVAVRMLVARLDPVLNLSADQRRKIAAALAKSNNPMAKSLDHLMYANGYLPAVDESDVVPFLDERQKTLWRDTQRVHFGVGFTYGISGLNLNEDDLAEEDDPEVAKELAKSCAAGGVFPGGMMGGMLRFLGAAPAAPAAKAAAPVVEEKPAVKAVPKAAVK